MGLTIHNGGRGHRLPWHQSWALPGLRDLAALVDLRLLCTGLAALLLAVGCSRGFKPFPAPSWELQDMDGIPVKSAEFHGKVVILDFWATWCPPCRQEIPGFIELQKKYGKDGLAIIGVVVGDEGPAVVKPFLQQEGVNYTILASKERLELAFGTVDALPTTFVIDRHGLVRHKHVGLTEAAVFEAQIRPLLAEKPPFKP